MPYIVLDESQVRILSESQGEVEVRGPDGIHLGYIAHGFTDADIRLARERAASKAPRLASDEVLARFNPDDH